MEEVIKLNEVDKYNKLFGLETRHTFSKCSRFIEGDAVAGTFQGQLRRVRSLSERYLLREYHVWTSELRLSGRYDSRFAPCQVAETEMLKNIQPNAHAFCFIPT